MTNKEIIKAFKCCNLVTYSCEDCPFHKDEKCTANNIGNIEKTIADILDRQQAEIERLKEGCKKLVEKQNLYKENMQATREYQIEQAKAEAIKEFAERLMEKSINTYRYDYQNDISIHEKYVTEKDIDNLVKEMVGEDK